MMRVTSLPRSPADLFGIGLSGLCALHCVLGLAATLAVSATSLSQSHHVLHVVVLVVAVGLSLFAFTPRSGRAASLPLALLAASGCLLLFMALLVGHADRSEMLLSILGSLTLSSAHILNIKRARA